MTEQPIEDELRELAKQIVAGPDDVAEFAAIHAETYKEERLIVLGMLGVDAMVAGDEGEIDERHPSLVALRRPATPPPCLGTGDGGGCNVLPPLLGRGVTAPSIRQQLHRGDSRLPLPSAALSDLQEGVRSRSRVRPQ